MDRRIESGKRCWELDSVSEADLSLRTKRARRVDVGLAGEGLTEARVAINRICASYMNAGLGAATLAGAPAGKLQSHDSRKAMVPGAGIEPARLSAGDFESPASTNFTTRAGMSEASNYGTVWS